MDTYKRSIRGLQSRSNGEHFEGMIIAASRFYEERGIAAVDKTPEAFKVLKALDRNRGQFICCFTKQAQPDFKGILMDSTMILFDATTRPSTKKSTKKKKTYRIVRGDTLCGISRKKYKTESKWRNIYNANKKVIEAAAKKHGRRNSDNGHWIYPGTVLTLP